MLLAVALPVHRAAMAKYHQYEISSAAFQIAIVLASATAITAAISPLMKFLFSWDAGPSACSR